MQNTKYPCLLCKQNYVEYLKVEPIIALVQIDSVSDYFVHDFEPGMTGHRCRLVLGR